MNAVRSGRRAVVAFCVGLALLAAGQSQAQGADAPPVLAITGANVVSLDGGAPLRNAVIVITGERISAVGAAGSVTIPAGAKRIALEGKWLMPGLMNMHTHFGLALPGKMLEETRGETDGALALRMLANARRSLLAGTTSVRTPGEQRDAIFAIKTAIDKGEHLGPRVWPAARAITPTGGHSSETLFDGIDGADEARKEARRQIALGAKWIKLMISRGIASTGDISASDMTIDEMRAVTDIAHRQGVKVTAHTGSIKATLDALEAGVDCFEHGYFLNEDVFKRVKAADAWYVPTIVVSQAGAQEFFRKIGSPPFYMARVQLVGRAHWSALQTAIRTGVNIAMGSDQFPFEPNEGTVASIREIELYNEAGMTPVQALRTATVNTARLLGAEKDLGDLSVGKYGDIIALDADPTQNVRALRTLSVVIKGGRIVRHDADPAATVTPGVH
jgi:imidazolonepropionase-like amidohydrolase